MPALLAIAALAACNPHPLDEDGVPVDGSELGQVGFNDGTGTVAGSEGEMNSERGSIVFTEFLWSGSVDADGTWDAADVFVEIKNEGNRPVNISNWRLIQEGTIDETYRIPETENMIEVGERVFIAAKDTGCFPYPDFVIPNLRFPMNAPFEFTLRDADERLLEPSGSEEHLPYAGGYDFVRSRSMERVEMMFGGRGTEPHMWHFHVPYEDDEIKEAFGTERGDENRFVVNNDLVSEDCRSHTHASPGRPNSPDYSGAYSTGSFE